MDENNRFDGGQNGNQTPASDPNLYTGNGQVPPAAPTPPVPPVAPPQPDPNAYAGQPGANPYAGQPDPNVYGGQPGANPYAGQPDPNVYGGQPGANPYAGQPDPNVYGGQPGANPYAGQPDPNVYGGQPGANPYAGQPDPYGNGNGGFSNQTPPPYVPQDPGYVPYGVEPPQPQKLPGDSMAIASMVLGIVGVVCCTGIGFIAAIIGIVLGFVSRSKGTSKEGMALAGIILGFVAIFLGIIVSIILISTGALANWLGDSVSYSYYY